MGILDGIIGSLLGGGGGSASSPLGSILGSILGGGGGGAGGSMGSLGGLLEKFGQAGHGDAASSWVGNGPNHPIDPGALRDVFGQHQVEQWSQQTGMDQGSLLSQLSSLIPHAVNSMTPDGQVPSASSSGGSPFDDAGVELPPRP